MRERKRKLQDKKGFTLVELIVVLVILAILAALLVPALTGYINRAKEKQLISECRQAVVAGQSLYSEAYGLKGSVGADKKYEEIKKLSEVPGDITSTEEKDGVITHLTYQSQGKTVVYCKNYKTANDGHKELYNLEDSESGGGDPGGDEPGGGGTGSGSITVGKDGTLTFTPGGTTYDELKAKADELAAEDYNKPLVDFPAGIYQVDGESWLVMKDFKATKEMFQPNRMEGVKNAVNNQGSGNYILKLNAKLLTSKDVIGGDHFNAGDISQGSIYEYEGNYYACLEPSGGWPGINPETGNNWIKVDSSYFN